MATAYPPADPRIANVLRNAAWVENAACPRSDVAAQLLCAWRHLTRVSRETTRPVSAEAGSRDTSLRECGLVPEACRQAAV